MTETMINCGDCEMRQGNICGYHGGIRHFDCPKGYYGQSLAIVKIMLRRECAKNPVGRKIACSDCPQKYQCTHENGVLIELSDASVNAIHILSTGNMVESLDAKVRICKADTDGRYTVAMEFPGTGTFTFETEGKWDIEQ